MTHFLIQSISLISFRLQPNPGNKLFSGLPPYLGVNRVFDYNRGQTGDAVFLRVRRVFPVRSPDLPEKSRYPLKTEVHG
jgi:hypothetical protein